MKQKAFVLLALALGLLASRTPAEAQSVPKVPRIGFLSLRSGSGPPIEAFRRGLRDLGYVEGQNIRIEYRWAEGKSERLPGLAAELVQLRVDIIVTGGEQAIRVVKEATGTIPIVMGASNDPVGAGLVTSLARPGGNVTGMTILSPELSSKRLELLKEVLPRVSRIVVLTNPAFPAGALDLRETRAAAQALGVIVKPVEIRGLGDFPGAIDAIKKERADALLPLADPLFTVHAKQIVEFAAALRLPAMYYWREFADAGGFMSYGPSIQDSYRRAAAFVDKILKGAKPADLPVEQPMKFELVLNLKTAQALGITMPPSLLLLADEVIQ